LFLRKITANQSYILSIKGYPLKSKIIHQRNYSHLAKDALKKCSSSGANPVVVYPDAFSYKSTILNDTKNKVGIYR